MMPKTQKSKQDIPMDIRPPFTRGVRRAGAGKNGKEHGRSRNKSDARTGEEPARGGKDQVRTSKKHGTIWEEAEQ